MAKSKAARPDEEPREEFYSLAAARNRWRAWALLAFWFVLATLAIAPVPVDVLEESATNALAQAAAPERIVVPDIDALTEERAKREQDFPRIWSFRPEAVSRAHERLGSAFAVIMANKPTAGSDLPAIAEEVSNEAGVKISSDDLALIYRNADLGRLYETLRAVVERVMSSRLIVSDKLPYTAQIERVKLRGVPEEITMNHSSRTAPTPLAWPDEVRAYIAEQELKRFYPRGDEAALVAASTRLLDQAVSPNLEFDFAATSATREASLRELHENPPTRVYEKGEQIVAAGEALSATQRLALAEAHEMRRSAYPYRLLGVILLALFCFGAVAGYFANYRREMNFTPSNVTMICLPVLIVLGIGRLLGVMESLGIGQGLALVLFPMGLLGTLGAIMLGTYPSFALILGTTLLFGVATERDFDFFVFSLFGGFTAVLSLKSLRQRRDVLEAGLRVGLVNMAVLLFLTFFKYPPIPNDPLPFLGAFLNGIVCASATLPLVAIFESAFGVVTDIRLLELTGPHHPLIHQMEERAPGTYQHVLNVTKLAESAAEAIGANFLLTRAGAYFHDVGKMLKPKYFSENQVTLEDKKAHSRLSPYMSVLIIKNHVKEGIELAREAGLPEKIVDFIPQHHGTSLIRYFYTEALQRYEETDRVDAVREEDFRYPGPKPQSIEAAIVMLSDSVEAIVTSVFTASVVNENDLRRVVAQAVTDRFNDGQFDECDLTLRDLFQIRESFVKTLKARFHQRIAYPAARGREPAARDGREGRESREANPATPMLGVAQG